MTRSGLTDFMCDTWFCGLDLVTGFLKYFINEIHFYAQNVYVIIIIIRHSPIHYTNHSLHLYAHNHNIYNVYIYIYIHIYIYIYIYIYMHICVFHSLFYEN